MPYPPEVDATVRPFYAKFGCPHYDELLEFAKRLGRDEWAFGELVLQGLMTGDDFSKEVKVQSIQHASFELAMFPSRLDICNERGHVKILQEANLALEENGTSLVGLRVMVKKELQYWRQLRDWRMKHGLDASLVDITSPTTLNHDFSALRVPLLGTDWCAEEQIVHLEQGLAVGMGGIGHKPRLSRCKHKKAYKGSCEYCAMSTTAPKSLESFDSTGFGGFSLGYGAFLL